MVSEQLVGSSYAVIALSKSSRAIWLAPSLAKEGATSRIATHGNASEASWL